MKKRADTKLVAILNITPDSFSDKDRYTTSEKAFSHLKDLIKQGADIIDIGAESTRPGADPISVAEEWERLQMILPAAIDYVKNYNQENDADIQISLDSRNYQNISKGLKLGIDIINDVSGFNSKRKAALAAASSKKIIVMHNLGIPADKRKVIPPSENVVQEVFKWMQQKECELWEYGVKKHQIIFDPGIGFGKTAAQSILLLNNIKKLKRLGMPLLIGHSNKSFLDEVNLDKKFGINDRENKTLAVTNLLARRGVEYLRVHNIAKNKSALKNKKFKDFEL